MRRPARPLRTGRTAVSLDGSVLVKEVFETTTGAMTTGTVSHAQTLKGWFVLMKDSKNSHPGNKLWGNGWVKLPRFRGRRTIWVPGVHDGQDKSSLPA